MFIFIKKALYIIRFMKFIILCWYKKNKGLKLAYNGVGKPSFLGTAKYIMYMINVNLKLIILIEWETG